MRSINHILAFFLLFISNYSFAHHSPYVFFDSKSMVEIEGTITYVKWANPHPKFTVESKDENGKTVVWKLEANAKSVLRRMGLDEDVVSKGIKVRAAGWPAVRVKHTMFVTNMLLPDNTEIVFTTFVPAMWSNKIKGDITKWMITDKDIPTPESTDEGIFHIWSSTMADNSFLFLEGLSFPLNEEGKRLREEHDLLDNPILGSCEFMGMPPIMEQPYPMELKDEGDRIILRMEEGDTVRTIYMDQSSMPVARPPAKLGYSSGKWEGETLVIETSAVSWPYIDNTGVPQSTEATYVERLIPSADGKRLEYEIKITDKKFLTDTITATKVWYWVPDAEVHPYECEE